MARQLGETDIAALLIRVEAEATQPSSITFLPYLTGERTPHNDPAARGAFLGLGADTTPSAMVRAVLEGVAFACVDARDCLVAAGSHFERLGVIGGGARSPFLLNIMASALNLPLSCYEGGDKGPAFGAARLARIACTGETVTDICVKPRILDVVHPDPELAAVYEKRVPHFRDLYRRLKGAFEPPDIAAI